MDRIKDSFARQGLMQTLGAELAEIAEGRVVITAPITPAASQQHGFAHAGMTFALGDSAAGYSALSLMPEGAEVLTAEMKINLLAPADGVRLISTGEVVKPGRKLVVVRATVETETADGTRKPVAILQGTMVPVIPKSG
ncbi:PaaI family thioesterase [Alterinioella nitratireducens]|uniref:PaaI family thioesterase n=1 Tax=Alterinioella nitratireducens TaxID=2735915 RepID=UPI0040593C2C